MKKRFKIVQPTLFQITVLLRYHFSRSPPVKVVFGCTFRSTVSSFRAQCRELFCVERTCRSRVEGSLILKIIRPRNLKISHHKIQAPDFYFRFQVIFEIYLECKWRKRGTAATRAKCPCLLDSASPGYSTFRVRSKNIRKTISIKICIMDIINKD